MTKEKAEESSTPLGINQEGVRANDALTNQQQEPEPTRLRLYLAEVLDAAANLLCVATAHSGGCRVLGWWLATPLGSWVFDTLFANRYPEYRGACDGCVTCGQKYKQRVPNPYYASERELAAWARWYGSDVSPKDYEDFWRGRPQTANSANTYLWSFCPNCGTGSIQTLSPRTA